MTQLQLENTSALVPLLYLRDFTGARITQKSAQPCAQRSRRVTPCVLPLICFSYTNTYDYRFDYYHMPLLFYANVYLENHYHIVGKQCVEECAVFLTSSCQKCSRAFYACRISQGLSVMKLILQLQQSACSQSRAMCCLRCSEHCHIKSLSVF